jgi:hypothetical protein
MDAKALSLGDPERPEEIADESLSSLSLDFAALVRRKVTG